MKKNKFHIFLEFFITTVCLWVCGIGFFIAIAVYGFENSVPVAVVSIIMLVIVPTLLLVWGLLAMAPQIEITEQGVIKSLFGIKMKVLKWEEIKFVHSKTTLPRCYWVFFSEKDVSAYSLSRARLTKGVIYFMLGIGKLDKIKRFAPDGIIKQLDGMLNV